MPQNTTGHTEALAECLWFTPATAEAAEARTLEPYDFAGFVCVKPNGEPYWPSARATADESMRMCFGPPDRKHLDTVAREGWRCVPINPCTKAEVR